MIYFEDTGEPRKLGRDSLCLALFGQAYLLSLLAEQERPLPFFIYFLFIRFCTRFTFYWRPCVAFTLKDVWHVQMFCVGKEL